VTDEPRPTRADHEGAEAAQRRVRRAIVGLAILLVLCGGTFLWISLDKSGDRWTALPATLACAADTSGVAQTADLVRSVELRHVDHDRMAMSVTFAQDPRNTLAFTFIVKDPAARDAAVVYRRVDDPAATHTDGWVAHSQAGLVQSSLGTSPTGIANALQSAEVAGTTARFVVNMAEIGGALPDGAFRPGVRVNSSLAATNGAAESALLATQTCPWVD
jgi:hypothetical protein